MALSVIGAGFSRTGTFSLKLALERLGFGPCCHMSEVFSRPDLWPLWEAAYAGAPDWDALFEGFASTVDVPSNQFYAELAARYPDAKVILTVRDPQSWWRSMRATLLSDPVRRHVGDSPVATLIRRMGLHGSDPRAQDPDHMLAWYDRHNASVIATIPAERLLVYRIEEGWEPLCRFLGVPTPDAGFPHVNSTEAFQKEFLEDFSVPETDEAASMEPPEGERNGDPEAAGA